MVTHEAWTSAGRPRSGSIFNDKTAAKRKYRSCIKLNKRNGSDSISDKLFDGLITKNQQSFWKIWQANFSKK